MRGTHDAGQVIVAHPGQRLQLEGIEAHEHAGGEIGDAQPRARGLLVELDLHRRVLVGELDRLVLHGVSQMK